MQPTVDLRIDQEKELNVPEHNFIQGCDAQKPGGGYEGRGLSYSSGELGTESRSTYSRHQNYARLEHSELRNVGTEKMEIRTRQERFSRLRHGGGYHDDPNKVGIYQDLTSTNH